MSLYQAEVFGNNRKVKTLLHYWKTGLEVLQGHTPELIRVCVCVCVCVSVCVCV